MVQEIVFSDGAIRTFEESVNYLQHNFSEKEIQKFTDRIVEKLANIKSNPRLGRKVGRKRNVYRTVVNKRIDLFYQYKPRDNEIVLLAFWNTLQDPNRIKL